MAEKRNLGRLDTGQGNLDFRRGLTKELISSQSLPSKLPRKEVIQPQLPLQLPCYDFVPVTSPTFDSSLPYGLGYRLQVLPAPMT